VLKDPKETWELLESAGADPTVTDSQSRIAAYYIDHPNEIELPDTRDTSGSFRRFTSGKDGEYPLNRLTSSGHFIYHQVFFKI